MPILCACLLVTRQAQRLGWFSSWLSSLSEKPTAVIDGPNVAYVDQNHETGGFRLQQVTRQLIGLALGFKQVEDGQHNALCAIDVCIVRITPKIGRSPQRRVERLLTSRATLHRHWP